MNEWLVGSFFDDDREEIISLFPQSLIVVGTFRIQQSVALLDSVLFVCLAGGMYRDGGIGAEIPLSSVDGGFDIKNSLIG